jgi:hypothetical protein
MFLTNNDRNLSSSIDAILKTGGSANLVSEAYDNSNNILQQMVLAEEKARIANRSTFMSMQQAKASEDRDQFFLNKYTPWKDQNDAIQGLSQQGMDNIWKGINTTGSSIISAVNPYGSKKTSASGSAAATPELSGGSIATTRNLFTPMKWNKPKLPGVMSMPGGNGAGGYDDSWLFTEGFEY